jgi:hypothetical protein
MALKGNGYMVCPAGIHGVTETTDLEEARETAADIASMYGKAIIYTALEVIKPRQDVISRQTRLGAAVLPTLEREGRKEREVPGMLAAAKQEETKQETHESTAEPMEPPTAG